MGSLLSAGAALGDYLSGLLQALAVLGVVAAFAFVALRFGALRAGLRPRGERLSVEDRLRLDARSQLVIVRVERRRLLIATHTDGAARVLAELGESPSDPALLTQPAPPPPAPSALSAAALPTSSPQPEGEPAT